MSTMYVELEKASYKKLIRDLNKLPGNTRSALRNAINRTAAKTMKDIRAGRSKGYTYKAKNFNSEIKVTRANAAHLNAIITAKGRTHTLQNFKTTMPKSGGKTDIVRTGLKRVEHPAGSKLFAQSVGGNTLPMQRTTAERYPLRVPRSVSTPKMVEQIYKGERGGQGDMEPKVRNHLREEIMVEIKKAVAKT